MGRYGDQPDGPDLLLSGLSACVTVICSIDILVHVTRTSYNNEHDTTEAC